MTDNEKQLLNTFESKLRHVLYLYQELKQENSNLTSIIEAKDMEIKALQSSCRKLEQDYTELKTVRTLSIYDKDIADTKKRLSGLVREVDRCIALLKK